MKNYIEIVERGIEIGREKTASIQDWDPAFKAAARYGVSIPAVFAAGSTAHMLFGRKKVIPKKVMNYGQL